MARAPMLVAADIPWGRGGLSVGVFDRADADTYRLLAVEGMHAHARTTTRLRRADATIAALRNELRETRKVEGR